MERKVARAEKVARQSKINQKARRPNGTPMAAPAVGAAAIVRESAQLSRQSMGKSLVRNHLRKPKEGAKED